MTRRDYTFPLRIDAMSQQTAQSSYAAHVDEMVRQVLLTAPGERVDLPQFGCGLRQLVFAPMSEALVASTQIQVIQSLGRWLSDVIAVNDVNVATSGAAGAPLDPGAIRVAVSYTLIDTQSSAQTTVTIT